MARIKFRRLADIAASRPGCRHLRTAQSTGTLVGLYGPEARLGAKWATVCEEHRTVAHFAGVDEARRAASSPEDWCAACAGGRT